MLRTIADITPSGALIARSVEVMLLEGERSGIRHWSGWFLVADQGAFALGTSLTITLADKRAGGAFVTGLDVGGQQIRVHFTGSGPLK